MSTTGDFFRRYDAVRTAGVPEAEQEGTVRRTWAARDARRRAVEEACDLCGRPTQRRSGDPDAALVCEPCGREGA